MQEGTTTSVAFPSLTSEDVLTGILRDGAQRMLTCGNRSGRTASSVSSSDFLRALRVLRGALFLAQASGRIVGSTVLDDAVNCWRLPVASSPFCHRLDFHVSKP